MKLIAGNLFWTENPTERAAKTRIAIAIFVHGEAIALCYGTGTAPRDGARAISVKIPSGWGNQMGLKKTTYFYPDQVVIRSTKGLPLPVPRQTPARVLAELQIALRDLPERLREYLEAQAAAQRDRSTE